MKPRSFVLQLVGSVVNPGGKRAAISLALCFGLVGSIACGQSAVAGQANTATQPVGARTVVDSFAGPVSAGVALTFDDAYIAEWYSARDLLRSYGAQVTFFVTRFDYLDDTQLAMLRTLQADGHEIASHGLRHLGVERDFQSDSEKVQQYVNEEILPSIAAMEDDGFSPLTFAYPLGERTNAYDRAVLDYFNYLRGTAYSRGDMPVSAWEDIYYGCGFAERVVYGVGMDESYGHTVHELEAGMRRASDHGEVMVLYGHRPADGAGDYRTSLARLEELLKSAIDLGLRFYTVAQLEKMADKDCG